MEATLAPRSSHTRKARASPGLPGQQLWGRPSPGTHPHAAGEEISRGVWSLRGACRATSVLRTQYAGALQTSAPRLRPLRSSGGLLQFRQVSWVPTFRREVGKVRSFKGSSLVWAVCCGVFCCCWRGRGRGLRVMT